MNFLIFIKKYILIGCLLIIDIIYNIFISFNVYFFMLQMNKIKLNKIKINIDVCTSFININFYFIIQA